MFLRLLDASPTPVRVLDGHGRTLHANPAWRAVWGEPPACGFPEGRAAREAFRRAAAGEIVISPVHFRPLQTRDRWLRTLAFPFGEWVALVHQDVSDLVQSRHELRKSRERWRRLLDLLPDFVGVHEGGRWVYLNRAALQMFGARDPHELLGKPAILCVHPDDRARVAARIAEGRKQRKPQPLVLEHLVRLDGSDFWAEVAAAPWPDGAEDAVIVVARDVTERVRAERENAMLRAAVEASEEPITLLDAACRIVFANEAAAKLYGIAREDLQGRHIAELRGGKPGDALFSEIFGTIQQGRTWRGEIQIRRANGEVRIVARRASPIMDAQGRLAHQIVIDRDITEERKQQEKLAHMQRLESLGVLAGGIAHDFNNLLAVILSHAALAKREVEEGSQLAKRLETIVQSAERGAELCRQLLAYAGRTPRTRKLVDLNELVRANLRLLEVSIPKHAELSLALAKRLPRISANPTEIHQLLMNLITNAAEALGEQGGTITLTTATAQLDAAALQAPTMFAAEHARPGRFVLLQVADTGCGMDETTKQRLFEPFFTTKQTGRGLGMSAVLGIVRAHRGAIRVDSAPGQGTCFSIWLPAAEEQKETPHARTRGLVLIAEQDASVREVACTILHEHGWHVLGVTDADALLQALAAHHDAVAGVVLDLSAAERNGPQLLAALRKHKPDLTVLLTFGGEAEAAVRAQWQADAVRGLLAKPYRPQALVEAVARCFGGEDG